MNAPATDAMQFYTRSRRKPTIIIVSLIDILAILLIFFIVTTTFKRDQPQVKISLPESTTAEKIPAKERPLLISVTSGGEVAADGTLMPVRELREFIARSLTTSPERPFALQADKGAPFGVVVQVMDAFKENGIRNLPAFTENRPEDSPKPPANTTP